MVCLCQSHRARKNASVQYVRTSPLPVTKKQEAGLFFFYLALFAAGVHRWFFFRRERSRRRSSSLTSLAGRSWGAISWTGVPSCSLNLTWLAPDPLYLTHTAVGGINHAAAQSIGNRITTIGFKVLAYTELHISLAIFEND